MKCLSLLCARLKLLRKRHSLTQEEFAEMAGFSYKFYQQIESGRKKQLWVETLERLAESYGLELWELVGPSLPASTRIKKATKKSTAESHTSQDFGKQKPK